MYKTITFLVSGNGGTLKFLYYAIELLKLPFEIKMVISDRNCGALEFAQVNNICSKVINYSKNNDLELIEEFEKLETDIIITNIHKILTPKVLSSIKADFINLHYSLLPAFGGLIGMKTVDEAKKQNCQFIGATCHEVTEMLDGGKILTQGLYSVDWSVEVEKIYDKVFKIACICFLNGLMTKYFSDKIKYECNYGIFNPECCFDPKRFDDDFWKLVQKT
ncbi:MAG: hypothetical protein IKK93_05600 [Campylobacter sp.]|nr:hypothetical protein [Campylobacter sp.]MBR6611705.1 hypothetical protein [Campylobacter sp.]